MPQETIRSRIYKSFLTCNDPKGIVDCSTVWKQKAGSSEMEKWIKSRRTRKISRETLDCKLQEEKTAKKGIVNEFDNSSSFQLMEVARDTQKLNQTIDSLSNRMKHDRQSEEIARDLFRGALELKESLVILGKLQEASWHMTQVEKDESTERGNGDMDMERRCFNRFECQKPRLSVDYSYENGAEELKKMIRDRLMNQILSPNMSIAEKTCFPENNMKNSASETASTSSSKTSMVKINREKKKNGKNLIANLMGLEHQPREMQETLHGQFLIEKISDKQGPMFCMAKTEARKPESVDKVCIIKHSSKGMNHHFNHFSYTPYREELTHTAPPIVLLKPLHTSHVELEEYQAQVVETNEALNKQEFIKLKVKENYPQKKVEALRSINILKTIEAEGTALSRIKPIKEGQNSKEETWRSKECVSVTSPKRVSHFQLNHNLPRKEVTDKNILKSEKVIATRKILHTQDKNEPKFQDQKQETPRKIYTRPNAIEEFIPRESISTPDTVSERASLKNQAIQEKVISEVTVVKSETIDFEDQNDDKKPDQTNSRASVLHMKDKADDSKYQAQLYAYCDGSQISPSHLRCRLKIDANTEEEASKHIDHEIPVRKTETNPKSSISSNKPSANRANDLFHLNANDKSTVWFPPDEPTPNISDGMDRWRNYKINKEMQKIISGLSWRTQESMEEAQDVVKDIEKIIFVALIHEIFT